MESYQKEAKDGKELNKDQRDALAKYPEVLGQIECVKELSEQFKKIQTEVFIYLLFLTILSLTNNFRERKIKNVS